tara:strand:+ start:441 stop:725 length:285 start_codon:yes stop_codon:yes gene_type:complete
MKKKLKAISSELKKASKTHAGQAAKIDKLLKPKLSKLHKGKRRLKRPKLAMMIGEQPPQDLKPKKSVFGKVAGLAALGGVAFGLSKLLKKKSKK